MMPGAACGALAARHADLRVIGSEVVVQLGRDYAVKPSSAAHPDLALDIRPGWLAMRRSRARSPAWPAQHAQPRSRLA